MITDSTALNRRRWRNDSKITASDMQLYRDLAHASGGQAIEVTKSELPVATSIITESFNSSLVISQRSHWALPASFVNVNISSV